MSIMYQALEGFVGVETWTTLHWADEERFFRALDKIIRNPSFNASEVGDYIERRYHEQFGRKADGDEAIRLKKHYEEYAQTISRYLQANSGWATPNSPETEECGRP